MNVKKDKLQQIVDSIGWFDRNPPKSHLGLWQNLKIRQEKEKAANVENAKMPFIEEDFILLSDNSNGESSSICSYNSSINELIDLTVTEDDSESENDLIELNVNSDLSSSSNSSQNNLINRSKSNTFVSRNQKRLKYNLTPWIDKNKVYSPGVLGLHQEIEDFCKFATLNQEEIELREYVFNKIKSIIKKKWPNSEVYLFGSYKTDLSLPTGDIDITVMGNFDSSSLFILESELILAKITSTDLAKVIDSAKVPIIKFIDIETDIHIDISFNSYDGHDAIDMIKNYKKIYCNMEKLVLLLKQFLYQRQLHDAFTGGVSSFTITLLVISFFQLHYRNNASATNQNLGVLLLEFLELYGISFNFKTVAISINGNGQYIPKSVLKKKIKSLEENAWKLAIQDPVRPEREICKRTFAIPLIKRAFSHAYSVLNKECSFRNYKNGANNLNQSYTSILGKVIAFSQKELDFRNNIMQKHDLLKNAIKRFKRKFEDDDHFRKEDKNSLKANKKFKFHPNLKF